MHLGHWSSVRQGSEYSINRGSEDEDTLEITLGKCVTRKLMGIIPINQWGDKLLCELTESDVIIALETFLEYTDENNHT